MSSVDPIVAELMKHFEGWNGRIGIRLKHQLGAIFERYARLAGSSAKPGDAFGILRRLVRLEKQNKGDLPWLLVQLARFDEGAMLPFQLKLVHRQPTTAMKNASTSAAKAAQLVNKRSRDRAIFNRILDYQNATDAKLQHAIQAVANGEDVPLGLLKVEPAVLSVSLVRSIFMKHIGKAKRSGLIDRPSGLFGATIVRSPLPVRRQKGRRRTKGSD